HVETLARRGRAAVVIGAVPRGLTHLVIVGLFLRVIPATADLIGPHGSRNDRRRVRDDRRLQRRLAPSAQAGARRQGRKGGGDDRRCPDPGPHGSTHSDRLTDLASAAERFPVWLTSRLRL